MRALIAVSCLSLLICKPAQSSPFTLMGEGALSCATFGQDYSRAPTVAEDNYFGWAQGYMSGLNALWNRAGGKQRILNAKTTDEQKKFIRDWCNKHPLADYSEAVLQLVYTLPALDEADDRVQKK
jgi:hypothetical protein